MVLCNPFNGDPELLGRLPAPQGPRPRDSNPPAQLSVITRKLILQLLPEKKMFGISYGIEYICKQ